MLSENVAYVARLLKEGRGEGRGSKCDIGKNKLSIVPPPPIYTLLATTDHSTVFAENHVTSPLPPLAPQKILFLPPPLSQLLAVFMITNLNNNEYLGVFLSGCKP